MRNSRHRLLNKYRQAAGSTLGTASDRLLVQEVMEEEWNSLQSVENCPEASLQLELPLDLAVLQDIEQELYNEEKSIISEYEKGLQFDESYLSSTLAEWEANPLICPVCINVQPENNEQCGHVSMWAAHPISHLTEQKLRAWLEENVNEHSAHCPNTPEFSVTGGTEEKPSLLMSCLACDTWAVIL
ncbi:RPA-interacting protein [Apodemus speciosus]|uniref:RPA-interacting protein n=1 Tax=Apodemus speciosus TaxID=105296 RepID=A0ABQ0FAU5_APOSI